MSCGLNQELLYAWLDGEAAGEAPAVEKHLESCGACRDEVSAHRRAVTRLRDTVDGAVGDVEPLYALARIRERIEQNDVRSPWKRLVAFWEDAWAYNRRAVAGVAVAAALGALSAPAVVYWARHQIAAGNPSLAAVVIESMEWEGDTKTVVYQGHDGATTLIWVEPDATDYRQENSQNRAQ